MYGYQLHKTLQSQGEPVQLSYLYKTLKEMCEEGLLESHVQRGQSGPRTRQYRLGSKGRHVLSKIFGDATELVHEFYEDYLSRLPPESFGERFHRMMKEVYDGRDRVAFVSSGPLTKLHRELLDGLCARSGAQRTYLIKPPDLKMDVGMPGLEIQDGTFEDLPFRDKSVDAMLVVDIQDAVRLRSCSAEFRRVLKEGGIVSCCAAFLSLGAETDPLEVGEFMKKMRRVLPGKPYLGKRAIQEALAKDFDYVDVASMLFFTAFVAGLKPV